MAKILTDTEMLDIVRRAIEGDEIDDAGHYALFLKDLGEVITDHFGGITGNVGEPDYPLEEGMTPHEGYLGWTLSFYVDENVPDDGGVYRPYDPDMEWRNGKELDT